ncbi:MAG: CPBP family intramembrane glutamic endopeptidase [archaeon]
MERKRGKKIIEKILQVTALDLILVFIPLLYYYRKNKSVKKSFSELGIKRIEKKQLAKKSAEILGGLIAIVFIISLASSFFNVNDLGKVTETVKAITFTSPLLLLYYMTVRVTAEEIFFRGFLVSKTGIWVSSIAFGLAHFMYGSVIEVFGAFIAGLFLAYFFQKNNNLVPNIIGHMAYNAVSLLMVM